MSGSGSNSSMWATIGTLPGREPPFLAVNRPHAHIKFPYTDDLLWKTLRVLNRPGGPGQFGEEGLQRVAQEAADLGRSHCRFRDKGTKPLCESGMKWMSGSAKYNADRAEH